MLIIPAIDLQQGRCVRLQQGRFDCVSFYESTPQTLAMNYANQGATHLHIVDLDGARLGDIQQLALIKTIKMDNITLQVGGGIRNLASATTCLAAGITKLVIGSIAISDPELTMQMIKLAGADNIVLAFDVHMSHGTPTPAIHGWQTATTYNLWHIMAFYEALGIKHVLCTDIACDGMMRGPNVRLYEEAINRFPNIAWQASGGIRHFEDIRKLAAAGIAAVIVGRALYESDLNLSACIQEVASC
ncbi:1-(5-phosphoribosyl)-5-[(5-phosphoribosylamino)methylideneamino] imidazole-4-carboxamide isomerase [Legionella oakridgensis]|uniref:1-(5-phosphoribosyl)-5-[(5- phosphoribosylamino)methylideneamino] imidazole-4-carboxamide isomerase n=1 Tax=Legionella oakridgensis TaxID=29423 RepID=UPI0003DDFD21|nr:1-(5-phosphoribosyl)-5-[(5-phosphoribosylamino)methylideneamino] imidazole-4-carboxamide isomerase [Legionella oakridgensis]ETO93644.1 1-(5-phosphoribosyl)-5-[(5-phosphoribosylamino)methylideneamino] imidazole-4-carboxamide isomerase [Legionella oakridgensis RV-2-2007]